MKNILRGASSFFSELRRRKVFRVTAIYVASAFVVAQVADIFLPGLGLPDWTLRLVLILLILGFPLAVVLSWMFDITPDGIRRTSVPAPRSTTDPATSASTSPASTGSPAGGRYELLERIGAGAMGVVYRARDVRLQRDVALKFLPESMETDSAAAARFLQEARAAAALNHPNITTLHAIQDEGDRSFLVMELVEGETLEDRLARVGAVSAREAAAIAAQVAAGLSAAHAKGIVHRDIKPANLMITEDGLVKIMDFGIAKVPGGPAMTRAGSTLGSAAYMSPEQVRGEDVDGRSDLWALGVVLYEMLSGHLPFPGDNEHTVLHGVLHVDPAPLEAVDPELPTSLTRAVTASLAKDRNSRPDSAAALLALLKRDPERDPTSILVSRRGRGRWLGSRRLAFAAPLLLVALVPAWWLHRQSTAESWARNVELPALLALVDAQDCLPAMIRANELESILPGDRFLSDARTHCSVPTTVTSNPSGADIHLRSYGDPDGEWHHLGTTPLIDILVPEGLHHWRVEAAGFEPIEQGMNAWEAETLVFDLIPEGEALEGMVRVPGGPSQVASTSVELGAFWIDRFEVTNARFQEFVDAGGYRNRALWEEVFLAGGSTLGWEEGVALLRDATGQPGPASWELGSHPDGQPNHPVSGVSWYEAVAFCRWAGKELPTAFHWKMASGSVSGTDLMFSDILWASNLDGSGPSEVGTYSGISRYGAYDMAGNVKEWTWNAVEDRRYILGGGWEEPRYMFIDLDAQSPLSRERTYGFRCIQSDEAVAGPATAPFSPLGRFDRGFESVSDEVYQVLLNAFAYDDLPLNPRLEQVDDESPYWRRETVSIDAAYGGERFSIHLFFPRDVSPPYQTVVYYPSGAAFRLRNSAATDVNYVAFVPRSGRVMVQPVLKGTYERRIQPTGPQGLRDAFIQRQKDLQRTVDYLLTRDDIDPERLAYFGISSGANAGSAATAIEDRFAVSILVAGGLIPNPDLPEMHAPNFAPRVRVPTLLISGRQDFMIPYEASQRPLFEFLGTPEEHKALKVFEAGHVPDSRDIIRESNAWLDRYLGPVRR